MEGCKKDGAVRQLPGVCFTERETEAQEGIPSMVMIPSKLMFVLHETSQGRDGQMDAQPWKAHGLACLCRGLPSSLASGLLPEPC